MKEQETIIEGADTFPASTLKSLTIDVAYYDKLLEGSDLSPADRDAFLRTMWSLIVSIVDLGYKLNPVQKFSGEALTEAHARAFTTTADVSSSGSKQAFAAASTMPGKAREKRMSE